MASKSFTIISLSPQKINAASYNSTTGAVIANLATEQFTPENLGLALLKISKSGKSPFVFLLDESFSFVITVPFQEDVTYNRETIRQKAQAFIPENLYETGWHFSVAEEKARIQVAAIKKDIFDVITTAARTAKLTDALLIPESIALANALHEVAPCIVITHQTPYKLIAIDQNIVISSLVIEQLTPQAVTDFIEFVGRKYQSQAKQVYFTGQPEGVTVTDYAAEGRLVAIKDIPVFPKLVSVLSQKKQRAELLTIHVGEELGDLLIADKKFQIPIQLIKKIVMKLGKSNNQKAGLSRFVTKKAVIIALIIVVQCGLFVTLYRYYQKNSKLVKASTPQTVASQSATVSATPMVPLEATQSAEVDPAAYSVSVFNGSGKQGEAAKLKAILEENGYTVTTTGNASEGRTTETTIEAKDTVTKASTESLDTLLRSYYAEIVVITSGSILGDDIVITIGTLK